MLKTITNQSLASLLFEVHAKIRIKNLEVPEFSFLNFVG